MSDVEVSVVSVEGGRPAYMLAEFETPAACLHAAEKLRDGGYAKFDAHTPFPVHGMDDAMGLPDSKLGWIVAGAAATGFTAAISMMWWMNGIDYALIIGGKPPVSFPSMAPVGFELTVLFSAFAAVFGMLGMNKLPRHHHPLFASERFRAATDDRFFISVDVNDPRYDEQKTRDLLASAHPTHIEIIEDNEP